MVKTPGDRASSRPGRRPGTGSPRGASGCRVVELVGALGRVGPRPVQAAALARQREELGPVLAPEHAQADARAGRRRGGGDLRGAEYVVGAAAEDGALHAGQSKRTRG